MNRLLLLAAVASLLLGCDWLAGRWVDEPPKPAGRSIAPWLPTRDFLTPRAPDRAKLVVGPASWFNPLCKFSHQLEVEGLPKAVPAGATVMLQNLDGSGLRRVIADEHGAFRTSIVACSGHWLRLQTEFGNRASMPVDVLAR